MGDVLVVNLKNELFDLAGLTVLDDVNESIGGLLVIEAIKVSYAQIKATDVPDDEDADDPFELAVSHLSEALAAQAKAEAGKPEEDDDEEIENEADDFISQKLSDIIDILTKNLDSQEIVVLGKTIETYDMNLNYVAVVKPPMIIIRVAEQEPAEQA